ncbi:MAG: helix-turn-helix domain-containing protein [Bacteroidales bacterium]|nr:helix-turn-helix domain-containing protein [Bacteroidales bacterium]
MLILLKILPAVVASSLYFHSLPSESTGINIRAVCQDAQGNMWFGGMDGITRYDGSRYTDFRYNADGENAIGDDHIYTISCDPDGTIWAGHMGGLSAFDQTTGKWLNYISPDGTIRNIINLGRERLLVTANYRLWLFDKSKGSFSRDGIPISLTDVPANVLYCPGDTIIYIGCRDGRLISASMDLKQCNELTRIAGDFQIDCLLADGPKHLWVGTEGNGLWDFSISEEKPIAHNHGMEYVRSLCLDEDGHVWAGTKNGLYVMREGSFSEFHHDYYDAGSITHDSVHDIFRDHQGTMWLGTFYGGVCYCTASPSLFNGIIARPGAANLNGQIISDIVEDSDGSLWIGTNSGGLNHLLPDGRFEHIGGLGENFSDQPDIKSIYISKRSGLIYIGADKGDLSILRPGSKKLKALNSVLQNGAYAIEGGPDGTLFIGTPNGLYKYVERSSKMTPIPVDGVQSNITALRLGRNGILWIGQKFGVAAIIPESGKEVPLPEELSNVRYVEDFLEDHSGRIWITSSDGLICISGSSVSIYTAQDGLPDNVIHGVEEDSGGKLWVSTNKGLCRFDPSTGEKWIFTVSDGLPGDRFTTYSHCRTRSGEMYFGGLSWLVHFNPEAINITYKEISPVISGIEIDGKWRRPSGKALVLKHKERDISIMFSAPDYISGQNGHFFYYLEGEGINDNVHEAGMDRTASYHGLSFGKYTFHLGYRNSAGIQSPKEASLSFTIPPHWYETATVKILGILILVSGVIVFVMRLLAKKKAEYQSEMDRVRNELLNEFSLEFVRIGAGKSADNESSVAKVFYKGDEEFMRKAMQVVKNNLDNPEFSVEALASAMNMSRSNLHVRSKALFGVSAHEFIKTVRFNEACRLLLEKKHSVAEIGYMVGFTTPSYFASAFHRFMGCTPTEYIRQKGV